MTSTIGVYDTHDKALEAIKKLQDAKFPVSKVSLIGRAEVVEDHLHIKTKENVKALGVGVGAVLGPVLGVLTGVGVFVIPGFGFLYGAGALVGALAGFDMGLIGGGIASALTMLGIKDDKKIKYEDHLKQGKFLVIANGNEEEVKQAKEILHAHGTHDELEVH